MAGKSLEPHIAMRVDTKQESSFADGFIQIPNTELDSLGAMISWGKLSAYLDEVEGDYPGLSLFKILLLQTWFSMSDQSVSNALHRDLVFMRFCGLSLDGPDCVKTLLDI